MKIEFYRTVFCPRCLAAACALRKIKASYPDLEIESIEVTTNLERTRRAKIRSVPALRLNDATLTGVILTPGRIRAFIERHQRKEARNAA